MKNSTPLTFSSRARAADHHAGLRHGIGSTGSGGLSANARRVDCVGDNRDLVRARPAFDQLGRDDVRNSYERIDPRASGGIDSPASQQPETRPSVAKRSVGLDRNDVHDLAARRSGSADHDVGQVPRSYCQVDTLLGGPIAHGADGRRKRCGRHVVLGNVCPCRCRHLREGTPLGACALDAAEREKRFEYLQRQDLAPADPRPTEVVDKK